MISEGCDSLWFAKTTENRIPWTETTRRHHDRRGLRYASDCTDGEWEIIAPFVERSSKVGRPCVHDLREIWNAIQYVAASGCQWRLLPKDFPPFTTVQYHFYRWRDCGLLALINEALVAASRLIEGREGDTTIPILAKGQCTTGRIWTYVRHDQPFGGPAPPAAVFYASRDRRGEHPQKHLAEFGGILQADCYNGFNPLFDRTKKQMPVTPAFCFAHARRKFFELADVARNARRGKNARPISPIALEAVKRIDALFAIERDINGLSAAERLAVRQEKSKPLLNEMEDWLRQERASLSRSSPVIGPIDYMLSRWADFARYADDGRICMTNNAAERALRGVACGRKSWLFAGSDRGADRAAIMLTLIMTARLNDVDPKAWLADILTRIADLPISRLHELLPWEWKARRQADQPASQKAA